MAKRLMAPEDRAVIAAVIEALSVPRDRLGRLVTHGRAGESLRAHACRLGVPGALDRTDQACMVLQALIGHRVTSVQDAKQ